MWSAGRPYDGHVTDGIRHIPATELDEECPEGWERLTAEPDLRGIDASLITVGGDQPYWSVGVAVAEFLRDGPLEADLRRQLAAALRAVEGAESVWEDDREAWGVSGIPSGEALVRAAAEVVDRLAPRARAYAEDLHPRWPVF
jgi:hypothetical protein